MDAEYDDNSYRVMVAVGFSIGITVIAIILRLLARKIQHVPLGADDFTVVAGAVFTIGMAITFIYSGQNGAGRHLRTIPPDELSVFWKATYAGYQTYGVAITLIKISVLLFYRRIFATPQFRLRTNIVGALVLAWLLINNLLTALQCRPIKKAWSPLTPGHCIEPLSLILGLQAGNVALDITILALPIFAVSKLQMSLAKKISVLGIFLLGGLSIVIAIIRIGVVASGDPKDVTWSSGIDSWTAVEPAIEVLSVCLPTMAPFLHGHKAVQEIRAAIRSALSLPEKSSSMTDNAGKFQKMEDDSKMFDLERNGIGTFTRADHQTRVAGDAVALHMIRVTDQVDVYLGEGRGRRGESC